MPGLGFLKQPKQILLWIRECLCNPAKAGFLYLVAFSLVVSPLNQAMAGAFTGIAAPIKTIENAVLDPSWGVLAMNTGKDVYQAGETIKIDMAVLNKLGDMVCNADLNLTVELNGKYYQDLSTKSGSIKVNPECLKKAKVNKPDFETGILADQPGSYSLVLTASTNEGTRQIAGAFRVGELSPFTIHRTTQTRIYPREVYGVDISVTAHRDFTGTIRESLPSSFLLIGNLTDSELSYMQQLQKTLGIKGADINPHKVYREGNRQYIDFSVSLKKGEEITLSYFYDAPDASPDLFALGPAEFFSGNRNETVYKEQRAWYIANDAVQTYQGTFEKATTTGSQVITGVGFQPKAIIFFWSRQDTVGFASSVMSSGFGFTTGASSQRSLAISEDYNVSTSNSGRYKSDTNSIVILSNGTPAVAATATLVSLDSSGFTLNWGLNENRHDPVNFLALGGDDISDVAIGTFNNSVSGASTGTQSVTGVGFKPDFVMLASGFTGNPNTATAGAQISVGWASASTSQAALNFRTRDGILNNTNKDSQQRTDAVALLYIATTGVDAVADFRSMDSDGFTINWSNAPASASTPFYYLAIKGGQHKVGNFFKPAATGYATTSTVGFQPRALMTGSIGKASSTSSQSPAAFMIGAAASSTAQSVVGSESKNNPSRVGNYLSTSSLVSVGTTTTTSFAVSGEAQLSSFNSDGFTVNWTTITDTNSREVVFWAIGDNPPINISGNVYSDEGSTGLAASRTIKVSVNGAAPVSTTTVAGSGQYNFLNVPASPGSVVTVFLDGASEKASVVTKVADTIADITGLNLYQDRVIVRHENGGPVTIANLNKYDGDNDSDIQFTATTSPVTSLTLNDGAKLIVWTGKTLTPGGSITTSPSSASATADGDVAIQPSATLNMETNQLSVGGDFSNYGTYSKTANQTTTFTAVGSGFVIENATSTFENLTLNGSGGTWTFASGTVAGDLTVTAGTLSGSSVLTVQGGDVTGNGAINLTGGTFTLTGTGNFGGSSDWVFNNLTFGAGGTSTTTGVGTATVTVSSTLTNYSGHTFNAGPKTWALAGVGAPFVNYGTFTASSSTISYRATSGTTTPASVTYNNLDFAPTSGSSVFSLAGSGSGWYNASWPYRKAITINHAKVASSTGETYQNFPVLVSFTDANLKASSSAGHVGRADGGDLLFTSSDGTTKLNHELELYSSSTGETIAWVKVPSLSTSTDTTLYLYYGNPSAPDQATTTGVWDSNYKAVLHLDDHGTVTMPDSTSVGTDGTKDTTYYPASYPDRTLAKIGYGLDSNSESDYFNFADTEAWTWDPLTQSRTFSLWFKPTVDFSDEANNFGFFKTYSADHHPYYVGWTKSAGASYLGVFVYNDAYNSLIGAAYAPWTMSFDQWYKLDFVAKPTGSVIYVNGQALAMSDIGWNTTAVSNPSNFDFRTEYSRGQGVIDEMRVSHSARSADWLVTEYNNQNSTGTFATVGSEEVPDTTMSIQGSLTVGGAGSATVDANTNDATLNITGSLVIGSGDTFLASNSSTTTIGSNLTVNGTFTHNSGTVVFNTSATSTISSAASVAFNNIVVTTAGKGLVFQKHTGNVPLFTIAGEMTLTGTSGSKINLQSDTPGSQWLVHFNSAQTGMSYVNVKDSGCDISSASVTNTLLTDQGNNGSCWGWATLVINQGSGGNSTNGSSGGGTAQTGGGQTGGSSTNGGSGVTAWGPVEISGNNYDGSEVEGTSWMADGYLGRDYVDVAGYHAGWTFVLPDIPANATIQKMYLRAYAIGASAGDTLNFYLKTQNVDPANRTLWSTSNRPSQASYVNAQSIQSVTLANNTWYFGEYDTKPINLAADLQGLITNYGAIAAGDSLNIAILWASVGGWVGFEDYSNAGTHHAQLYIEWRVVTGAQTGGGQSGGGATP